MSQRALFGSSLLTWGRDEAGPILLDDGLPVGGLLDQGQHGVLAIGYGWRPPGWDIGASGWFGRSATEAEARTELEDAYGRREVRSRKGATVRRKEEGLIAR